jgi:hypothetical protein
MTEHTSTAVAQLLGVPRRTVQITRDDGERMEFDGNGPQHLFALGPSYS